MLDNLNSIPRTLMVEGENWHPQILLWQPYICHNIVMTNISTKYICFEMCKKIKMNSKINVYNLSVFIRKSGSQHSLSQNLSIAHNSSSSGGAVFVPASPLLLRCCLPWACVVLSCYQNCCEFVCVTSLCVWKALFPIIYHLWLLPPNSGGQERTLTISCIWGVYKISVANNSKER